MWNAYLKDIPCSLETASQFQQHSWKWFLYHRCQNQNRPPTIESAESPRKRAKIKTADNHPYPTIPPAADDAVSNERNLELLQTEMAKSKPRRDVQKQLMVRTFPQRRQWILDEAKSVKDIISTFPLLKKGSYVSTLILSQVSFFVKCNAGHCWVSLSECMCITLHT